MKKAVLNYWVDVVTGAAMLVCAATGIVRLFPEATSVTSDGATIFGITSALWATVHDWSGVVMAAGVAVHTLLHLPWLAHMTGKIWRGETSGRAAARQRRAASPQAAAAASLARLEAMGGAGDDRRGPGASGAAHEARDRGDDTPRMTRKAFLYGAAAVGGAAALAGVGLLKDSASDVAAANAGTTSTSLTSGSSSSGGKATSASSDSGSASTSSSSSSDSSGTSTASSSSARVAVDSGACVGCGHCVQSCPHGVFTMSGGTAVASNAASCTLCGRCVSVCRPQAITLNG